MELCAEADPFIELPECGRSKMCRVDLSDVTASREFEGEIANEKISA